MITKREFIRQSLELNLFFLRIMKEHAFFLAGGFTPKNSEYIQYAKGLNQQLSNLLMETVSLSQGMIRPQVIKSNEIVTQYTKKAEEITQFYTGVPINTNITAREKFLASHPNMYNLPDIDERVYMLNHNVLYFTSLLIEFKEKLIKEINACRLFTFNYVTLIEHILREAKLFVNLLSRLQKSEKIDIEQEQYVQEAFWNRIMEEHALFIRGLLDPSEEELIQGADDLAKEFESLQKEVVQAIDDANPRRNITEKSLRATEKIKQFKAQGTEGLIQCKVKAVILPLLGDHVLREANHYLRLLESFKAR